MDSNTSGSFFFRGTAKIFLSTFTGLLSGDVDLSASVIGAARAKVEPRRAHQYYEFIRFDAHEMPDGTLVRWYTPEKANLGAVALEIVEKFRARGYVVDADATPRAGTEPAPGMVGEKVGSAGRPELRSHKRARERLQAGENEQAVKIDWRRDYEDETGETPDQTASGEVQLWRNVKRGVKSGKK